MIPFVIKRLSLSCLFLVFTMVIAVGEESSQEKRTTEAAVQSEAIAVQPANFIFHGVFVKSPFDTEKQFVKLKGPRYFSLGEPRTWYEIYKPKPVKKRLVRITATDRESGFTELELGDPAFFSNAAKRLTSGPPTEKGDADENHYIAYRVVTATVNSSVRDEAWLAVPTEQWHHDEYYKVVEPRKWWLIQKKGAGTMEEPTTSISILDQFGLNRLTPKVQAWQVRAVAPVSR